MTEHVAEDRIVYTLQDPWPVGVLTGYVKDGGFYLEHVLALKRGVLMRLLKMGMAYAWAQGWAFIVFHVPTDFPLHPGLHAIGRRLGFVEYEPTFYLLRRPSVDDVVRGGAVHGVRGVDDEHALRVGGHVQQETLDERLPSVLARPPQIEGRHHTGSLA